MLFYLPPSQEGEKTERGGRECREGGRECRDMKRGRGGGEYKEGEEVRSVDWECREGRGRERTK